MLKNKLNWKRLKIILILLSLIFTLNVHALEKVKLQLKWKTQFQFAGFIAAKEKGFYKDVGLDVALLEYSADTDTLEDLKKGKTTFSVSDSSIITEVAKGGKYVALMAIYQQSPYVLMSLASSNIHSLKDLQGKKVGFYSDINSKAVAAMLKDRRILFQKVQVKNSIEQLETGEVDSVIVYSSNEPYQAKEKSLAVDILHLNEYGFDRYGDILITLEKTVNDRPELVAKMDSATRKGFEYAYSHIDEMVELIYRKYNTLKRSKVSYYYEADTLKKFLGSSEKFGKLDKARVNAIGYIYAYYNSIEPLADSQRQPTI